MNRHPVSFDGAVLVGGQSARMGTDKAKIIVDGSPMWKRQLRMLEGSGAAEAFLVLRKGQRRLPATHSQIRDQCSGIGPIAGIQAALIAAKSPLVAVCATDLPFLDSAWFKRLRLLCDVGRGAVARGPDGYEPLAAIYPRESAEVVADFIARGSHRLQDLVETLATAGLLSVVTPSPTQRRKLVNWNTPQDLASPSSRRTHPRQKS